MKKIIALTLLAGLTALPLCAQDPETPPEVSTTVDPAAVDVVATFLDDVTGTVTFVPTVLQNTPTTLEAATMNMALADGSQLVLSAVDGRVRACTLLPTPRLSSVDGALAVLDGTGQVMLQLADADKKAKDDRPKVRIGVRIDDAGEALAAQLDIQQDEVSVIVSVTEGGPSEKAGVRQYDVMTAIDGEGPGTLDRLRSVLKTKKPGDLVKISVIRQTRPVELTVKCEARPESQSTATGWFTPQGTWKNTFINVPQAAEYSFAVDPATQQLQSYWTPAAHTYRFMDLATPAPDGAEAKEGNRLAALEERLARIEALLKERQPKKKK